MSLSEFSSLLTAAYPPKGISIFLQALWNDHQGNWSEAHTLVQDLEDKDSAWIHGYLHRKEGDEANARYWYIRAGRKFPTITLTNEWEEMVSHFLKD